MNPSDRLRALTDATIAGVISDLERTHGGRNKALHDAAVRLGALVAAGLMRDDDAAARLLAAAESNGYVRKDGVREAAGVIRRGLRYGEANGALPSTIATLLHTLPPTIVRPRATPPRRVESPRAHDATRPPSDELAGLWARAGRLTDDSEACAMLDRRRIDPRAVEEGDLARVLAVDCDAPAWATGPSGPWTRTGYRLLVPLYDAHGTMRSAIARDVTGLAPNGRKSLAPRRYERRGLIMADPRVRAGLAGGRVLILEGEIDYLFAATRSTPSIGIVQGSWTDEHAARVPDGADVVIATDPDDEGEKYAARIGETFRNRRVRVLRWRPCNG